MRSFGEIYRDHNDRVAYAVASTVVGKSSYGVEYEVELPNKDEGKVAISFQDGPVSEVGANGVTSELLLSVLIHRLKFQDMKLACDENKRAISHLEEALVNLEARTFRRALRGVEGKAEA